MMEPTMPVGQVYTALPNQPDYGKKPEEIHLREQGEGHIHDYVLLAKTVAQEEIVASGIRSTPQADVFDCACGMRKRILRGVSGLTEDHGPLGDGLASRCLIDASRLKDSEREGLGL